MNLLLLILHPGRNGDLSAQKLSWGDMDADAVFEEDTSSQEELDHLHEFNYNSLNYEQQLHMSSGAVPWKRISSRQRMSGFMNIFLP